jgi:hypothetical protein
VLEARALTALGKFDNANEILRKDNSVEAMDARADIYWRQKDWVHAGQIYEKRLGDRWKTPGAPLSGEDETRLIRAGVAYSIAGDSKALQGLAGHYSSFIQESRSPEALRVALADLDGGPITPSDLAKASTQADTFVGWVAGMKQRFRDNAAKAVQTAASGAGASASGV